MGTVVTKSAEGIGLLSTRIRFIVLEQ
jgi:hypothetical protein